MVEEIKFEDYEKKIKTPNNDINFNNDNIFIVIFLFLSIAKFTGYWNISWWWVTAPLWLPLLILIIGVLILYKK